MRQSLLCWALFISFAIVMDRTWASESDLFTFSPADFPPDFHPGPPPPILGLTAEWPVTVNVRGIAGVHDQIRAVLPDGLVITFAQRFFEPVEGFVLNGIDAVPAPNVADSDLSYRWYGTSGNSSMTLSVRSGYVSASIIGTDHHYSIASHNTERAMLRVFNPQEVPSDEAIAQFSVVRKHSDFGEYWPQEKDVSLERYAVDVLVLHSPLALGSSGSRSQLNAAIDEAFMQANLILKNSGIEVYHYRNAVIESGLGNGHSSLLLNYDEVSGHVCPPPLTDTPLCNYFGHRVFLRNNPQVQTLRDQLYADLVVLLVEGADAGITGLAYVQRPDCANEPDLGENDKTCTIGAGYSDFAFSVVSINFITSFQVFAHEAGHQMGMEHNSENAVQPSAASFPYAFGHYANGINETVMSIRGALRRCPNGCPRAFQFSNPDINFLNTSIPSGTGDHRNARVGSLLAPAVAAFRTGVAGNLIFANGFETFDIPD